MNELTVVLLKKNLSHLHHPETVNWILDKHTHWISFGHFDDIFIYSLTKSNDDILKNIQEDKRRILMHNNERTYYHPLYLIPYDRSKKQINNWFIAISRIHFSDSLNLTDQTKLIGKEIIELLKKKEVSYQIYYATEFSDMVLDIRSNRLKDLLDIILQIRNFKNMKGGKMYTYFGINSFNLEHSTKLPERNDKIDLFSVRFSGCDLDLARNQIDLMNMCLCEKENTILETYCINGLDDIMLIYRDCSTSSIVELYREWLFKPEYKNIRKPISSTKVGVKENYKNTNYSEQSETTKLSETYMCKGLSKLCEKTSKMISLDYEKYNFSWFHTISEIANSLVRMADSPIMDEVVFLIAPSVHAFLKNIINDINYDKTNKLHGDFFSFAESCSYFIEQLMRIEGQLSHNPEIRPVIYDIPVFMLEYTIAFLNKVSEALKKNDSKKASLHTAFLLVPCPCERISASEIFPVQETLPGLVHIKIPENTLYSPKELFRALCHEISHYVGESYRSRDKRKFAYTHAVSAFLINRVFQSNDPHLCEMFKKTFLSSMQDIEQPTIKEMHSIIVAKSKKILSKENCINNILRNYFSLIKDRKTMPTYIDLENYQRIIFKFSKDFEHEIVNIDILFREVYADICMIHILDINSDDYINSLLPEIHSKPLLNNISDEMFAIRIFVTLSAIKKDVEYHYPDYLSTWNRLIVIINQIKLGLNKNTDGLHKLPIPITSIYALLEYATYCYEKISISLTRTDLLDVKSMYSLITDDSFNYKNIIKEIEFCRNSMIKDYEQQ